MKLLGCFKKFFARSGAHSSVSASDTILLNALEQSKEAFFLTDHKGVIQRCNHACLPLFKAKSKPDLYSRGWADLFCASDIERLRKFISESSDQAKRHWVGYIMAVSPHGYADDFPLEVSITRIDSDQFMWVCRDYSESLEYISTANKRSAAMNAASDGIAIIDANGNFSYLNGAMLAIHGISETLASDFIGREWTELYAKEERDDIRKNIIPALEKDNYWKGDTPTRSLYNDLIHVEMSLTLLPDGSMIGTAHDNSKQKIIEQEKEQIQKQFFQAQKMESLGRLAGGIAHDFNNILAAVKGYAEFLVDDLDKTTESAFHAQQIMQGTVQAQNIIEQILAFSKSSDVEVSAMNIVECVEDTLSILRPTIPPFVSVKSDVSLQAAYIIANKTQMSQAIMNLCLNGLHSLDKGQESRIAVEIKSIRGDDLSFDKRNCIKALDDYADQPPLYVLDQQEDKNLAELQYGYIAPTQNYIEVSIEDNGHGISRAMLEKIFDPFFTTKEKDKGTGLGLSTVHGVVAGFRGALKIRTTLKKGSRFSMYFPAEYVHEEAASNTAAHGKMVGVGNIVLIDDEDKVRAVIEDMLIRMGYNAISFTNGFDAIKHIQEHDSAIDLVISDYTMPSMTGAQFSEKLYKDYPDLPVIIVSGFAKEKLHDLSDSIPNIHAVIPKPINRALLYESIEKAMVENCDEEPASLNAV